MTKKENSSEVDENEKDTNGRVVKPEEKRATQLTLENKKPEIPTDAFGKCVLAKEIFKHPQLEELKRVTRAAISQQSMLLLIGPPGVGKTTAVRSVTDELPVNKYLVVYLGQDQNGCNLLIRLAQSLGMQPKRFRAHLALQIGQWLTDNLRDGGRRVIVVADEAHLVDDTTLEDLRLLSNADYDRQSPYTLILVAQPWLRTRLKSPYFEPLIQRLRYRYCLEGLSKSDTIEYVRQRLVSAGIAEDFFTAEALESIFAYSEGIPRRINNVSSQLLLRARLGKLPRIDAAMVKHLAESQDL